MDFFAYIKFNFNKEECWKKVSDIKEKKYNKNGNVEMSPFDPKTISDFTANKWYFAKWDSEDVQTIRWSKINILYVADKEDENLKHVRKRYTNAKVIESESSFEEENEFNESQKKMKILKKNKAVVSEERALNVLQKLKKSFKPLAFVDNDFEDNVSIASSTKNQNVTVLIERMDDKVLRNVTNFSNICSKSVTTLASELSRKKCNAKSSAPQRSDSISSILEELTDCFDGKNLNKRLSQEGSQSTRALSKSHCHSPCRSSGPCRSRSASLRRARSVSVLSDQRRSRSTSSHRYRSRSRSNRRSRSRSKSFYRNSSPLESNRKHGSPSTSPRQRKSLCRSSRRTRSVSHSSGQHKSRPTSSHHYRSRSRSTRQSRSRSKLSHHRPHSMSHQPQSPCTSSCQQTTHSADARMPQSAENQPAANEIENIEQNDNIANRRAYQRIYKRTPEFLLDCIQYYKAREGYAYQEISKRYKIIDGNNVYLGENISIPSLSWEIMKSRKPSIFLRELALQIWDEHELCNRALDLTRGIQNIPSRSPVKLIEKNRLRLLISLYNDYLKNQPLQIGERVSLLMKSIYILRHKIRDLRAEAMKTSPNPRRLNLNRRLRYNVIDK